MNRNPIFIGITLGDAGGIGPEVARKAVARRDWPSDLRFVLLGDPRALGAGAGRRVSVLPRGWEMLAPRSALPARVALLRRRARVFVWDPGAPGPLAIRPGRSTVSAARAAACWIEAAVAACRGGALDAMVTGPIAKHGFAKAGLDVPGNTELLARLTGTPRYAMMLTGGPLRVVLVTRHLPLARVPAAVTAESITTAVRLAAESIPWLRIRPARIAVCALNPHAGDGGALGAEEQSLIRPTVRRLRRAGLAVEGPIPGDVVFHRAVNGAFGVVVAMYHDQGLAPLKMLAFESGVNVTLGLPIVRTSPDHGTAFDIAGSGKADPGSMVEAIRTAYDAARRPNPWRKR